MLACMLPSCRSVRGQHVWGQMLLSKGHKAVYPMLEPLLHTWSCLCVGVAILTCLIMHMAAATAVTWQNRLQRNGWVCKCVWSVSMWVIWLVWMGSKRVNALTVTNVRETRRIPVSPGKMSQFREASSDVQWRFIMPFFCCSLSLPIWFLLRSVSLHLDIRKVPAIELS